MHFVTIYNYKALHNISYCNHLTIQFFQPNNSHALMNMRDALLWVLQKSRKKSAEMEELKRENAELKEKVEEQGSVISR